MYINIVLFLYNSKYFAGLFKTKDVDKYNIFQSKWKLQFFVILGKNQDLL